MSDTLPFIRDDDDASISNEDETTTPSDDIITTTPNDEISEETRSEMACSIMRFLILASSVACIAAILANMQAYNFTKICFDPAEEGVNRTTRLRDHFTKIEQSALQAGIAIGALAGSGPYALLFQRYSRRLVFASAGIISIVMTALIPLAVAHGFWPFFFVRIIEGIGFSSTFAMMGAVTSDWAPLAENGFFLAVLTGSGHLANVITSPIAGAICSSSLGWPAVFYSFSAAAAIIFIFWFLLFRDTPDDHAMVGQSELQRINHGKTRDVVRHKVPYAAIFRSKCVWGCWIAAFGDLIATQYIAMYNPVFMNSFLQFSIFTTGFLASFPTIAQFCFKVVAGILSDVLTCTSETWKVRLFDSFALGGSGLLFLVIAWIPRDNTILAIVILVLAMGVLGMHSAGFNKCATLHSRQHSHFVMAMIVNIWAICILIEPFVADTILQDNTSAPSWRILFIGHGILLLLSNAIFVAWADATPAAWTVPPKQLRPDYTAGNIVTATVN